MTIFSLCYDFILIIWKKKKKSQTSFHTPSYASDLLDCEFFLKGSPVGNILFFFFFLKLNPNVKLQAE